MAGVDRSLAAKARKQDASLQPTPKADQAPQHDSTEGVTFDGKLLSIEGMDDPAPDASPHGEAHHDDPDVNAATAVPVEPASIAGLPIVEPTLPTDSKSVGWGWSGAVGVDFGDCHIIKK